MISVKNLLKFKKLDNFWLLMKMKNYLRLAFVLMAYSLGFSMEDSPNRNPLIEEKVRQRSSSGVLTENFMLEGQDSGQKAPP